MNTVAWLVLDDGTAFRGEAFGAATTVDGEVVFNTSMSGYPELLTDPSYRRQLLTLTVPEVGNYGVCDRDFESDRIQAAGLIVRRLSTVVSNWRSDRDLSSWLKDNNVAGIAGIDCAGAGGTSWAKVEGICAKTERRRKMGLAFGEWGIPTVDAIRAVRSVSRDLPLVATGGLRSGLDLAKALALGADVGAMARPMLVAGDQGEDFLHAFITDTLDELRVAMFGIGAGNLEALRFTPHLVPAAPLKL